MPNLDPYDKVQDARSEARYEPDPRAEPQQWELDENTDPVFVPVDESTGFRG